MPTKQTPQIDYVCANCGAYGVKLWRKYNTLLEDQVLRCAACACRNQHKEDNVDEYGRRMASDGVRTDQIGWLIPAVPTEDWNTYWGYTSVPGEREEWWRRLPTRVQISAG